MEISSDSIPQCDDPELEALDHNGRGSLLEELAYMRGFGASPLLGEGAVDHEARQQQLGDEDEQLGGMMRPASSHDRSLYYEVEEHSWQVHGAQRGSGAGVAEGGGHEEWQEAEEGALFSSHGQSRASRTSRSSAAHPEPLADAASRRMEEARTPTEALAPPPTQHTHRQSGEDTARRPRTSRASNELALSTASSAAILRPRPPSPSSPDGSSSSSSSSSSSCSSSSSSSSNNDPLVPLSSLLLHPPVAGQPPLVYVPYLPYSQHYRRKRQPPPPSALPPAAIAQEARDEGTQARPREQGRGERPLAPSQPPAARTKEPPPPPPTRPSHHQQEEEQEQGRKNGGGEKGREEQAGVMQLLRCRALLSYVQTLACALDKVRPHTIRRHI
jgi:hypothetical protein